MEATFLGEEVGGKTVPKARTLVGGPLDHVLGRREEATGKQVRRNVCKVST